MTTTTNRSFETNHSKKAFQGKRGRTHRLASFFRGVSSFALFIIIIVLVKEFRLNGKKHESRITEVMSIFGSSENREKVFVRLLKMPGIAKQNDIEGSKSSPAGLNEIRQNNKLVQQHHYNKITTFNTTSLERIVKHGEFPFTCSREQ